MKNRLLHAAFIGAVVVGLSGCLVVPGPPPGEPVYEPPVAVVEPSVSTYVWFPWPHYEVEHRYVVENEHVTIRDRHYFPSNGRGRAYIRNDNGQHRGWYKHDRDR